MEGKMTEKEFEEQLHAMSERVLSKALTQDEENSYTESLFESIKHINEYGQEFWYARELQVALEYKEWRNFMKVIDKAKTACEGSENAVSVHFVDVNKMVDIGLDMRREVDDIQLSRYASLLKITSR
jgi:DNA-damage-inducible protein D